MLHFMGNLQTQMSFHYENWRQLIIFISKQVLFIMLVLQVKVNQIS